MIYQNEVTLAGPVVKAIVRGSICRVWMNVPAGDQDDDYHAGKTMTVQVDVVGEENIESAKLAKEGDYLSCKAQLIQLKMQADGADKKYSIRWLQALKSRPVIVIPDGGKYAKTGGMNEVSVQGKVQRMGELRTSAAGKKMLFVTVGYIPKLDKNATDDERKNAQVYVDVAFFGGTAENYIQKYLKEGDCILVQGTINIQAETWKSNGKEVLSTRINARESKFLTPVLKDGKFTNKDKPETAAYDDENLPF